MMKSLLLYYKYPQYLWSKEIAKILKSGQISNISTRQFFDAPCGDGVISYWLKKEIPQLSLNLFDLNDSLVATAKAHCGDVKAETASIYDTKIENNNNVWLLINSLYCLPDKESLIRNMGPGMEYIIAVFPHLDNKNYQYLLEQNPDLENPSAMTQDETIDYFNRNGFKLVSKKDVTFISPYAFSGVMRLAGLTKRILNLLDYFFRQRKGCYWLAVFVKK